ncbi:MAG: hypothetical protein FWD18_00115 [Micrococcales bacterium]|nr:hypothetical protein [Micrococcales bacterium]
MDDRDVTPRIPLPRRVPNAAAPAAPGAADVVRQRAADEPLAFQSWCGSHDLPTST